MLLNFSIFLTEYTSVQVRLHSLLGNGWWGMATLKASCQPTILHLSQLLVEA